jgi:hypothetical protein
MHLGKEIDLLFVLLLDRQELRYGRAFASQMGWSHYAQWRFLPYAYTSTLS